MKQDELKYHYRYPHPAVTADCVIFGFDGKSLKVLLIERGLQPFLGMWALPGGFMKIDETIEQTAVRELQEETGLKGIYLEQFKTFSSVLRDPRERVLTVAFIALVRPEHYRLVAGDDAADARWFDIEFLPPMAFDHADIITQARRHLSEVLRVKPIAFELLSKYFSLAELQRVYEAITGRSFDRRNFQRKAIQSGIIAEAPSPASCPAPPSPHSAPDVVCECSSPSPSAAPQRPSRPGRPGKLFSFLKPKKEKETDEDASIKDLFNF